MDEKPTSGSTTVAVTILCCVGLANMGYAAFRMVNGKEDNLPLFITGFVAVSLAVILGARGRGKT